MFLKIKKIFTFDPLARVHLRHFPTVRSRHLLQLESSSFALLHHHQQLFGPRVEADLADVVKRGAVKYNLEKNSFKFKFMEGKEASSTNTFSSPLMDSSLCRSISSVGGFSGRTSSTRGWPPPAFKFTLFN